ncbi:MAG: HNH endonuclease, partial [Myxococcales bacterium]
NLDHVVPRSRGGVTSWENVVCSCVGCNLRKGGRTPEEAHMRLTRHPSRPRWTPFFRGPPRSGAFYQQWLPFLTLSDMAYWNTELAD